MPPSGARQVQSKHGRRDLQGAQPCLLRSKSGVLCTRDSPDPLTIHALLHVVGDMLSLRWHGSFQSRPRSYAKSLRA